MGLVYFTMLHFSFNSSTLKLFKFVIFITIIILIPLGLTGCFFRGADTVIPTFSTNRLTLIEKRVLSLEQANNYEFRDLDIGLEAFDNRDGNITKRIEAQPLGLELIDEGFYYYIRFSVEDRSSNYNYIDIPFIVYESKSITGNEFFDYLDVSYEYFLPDWDQYIEQFSTVKMEQSVIPNDDHYCIYIENADLESQYLIESNLRHTNGTNMTKENEFSSVIKLTDTLVTLNGKYIDSSTFYLYDTFRGYDASITTNIFGTADIYSYYTESPFC